MPISLKCDCGRSFRLKDELAGRKVRCPACQTLLTVPDPKAEEEAVAALLADDADEPQEPPRAGIRAEPPSPEQPLPRPRPSDESSPRRALAGPVPAASREKRPPSRRAGSEPEWFARINPTTVGGLLMMLLAVIWFVFGLAVGIIYFYPPILFGLGVISLVKGLSGGNRSS